MNINVPPAREKVVKTQGPDAGRMEHALAIWLEQIYTKLRELEARIEALEP